MMNDRAETESSCSFSVITVWILNVRQHLDRKHIYASLQVITHHSKLNLYKKKTKSLKLHSNNGYRYNLKNQIPHNCWKSLHTKNCHLEDKSIVYCGCVVEDNHQKHCFWWQWLKFWYLEQAPSCSREVFLFGTNLSRTMVWHEKLLLTTGVDNF